MRFHADARLRIAGVALLAASTALYVRSVRQLGDAYAPCYDACLPARLVTSGPYRVVRHPMYAPKFGVAAGSLLVAGSLWLLPMLVYLVLSVGVRAARRENETLGRAFVEHAAYRARTPAFLPRLSI